MGSTRYGPDVICCRGVGAVKVVLASEGLEGDICVVIDNKAVQAELQGWIDGTRTVLGNISGVWDRIRRAAAATPGLRTAWIPSHNKEKEGWEPPDGWTEDECRRLNKNADAECTAGLERLNRLKWEEDRLRDEADARMERALQRVCEGSDELRCRFPPPDNGGDGIWWQRRRGAVTGMHTKHEKDWMECEQTIGKRGLRRQRPTMRPMAALADGMQK